jgi:hypothetical protein
LTILGILASVDVEDFLLNLEDLLLFGSVFLGSWETSLFVDEIMMLCNEI